jgi:hypothetical protein
MPDGTVDLLFRILRQNGGKFSNRARDKEFAQMTEAEAAAAEGAFAASFESDAQSRRSAMT